MRPEEHRLDCTIRAPQPADFEKIAELTGQLGYPCTPQEVEKRLAGMQDKEKYAVYVAALANGEIAGWIGMHLFCCVELDIVVEINGLVVDKNVRSRGIGKRLLSAAERWALSRGYDAITVRSNVRRHDAHRFYEKNGYGWTKTQKSFRKVLMAGDTHVSRGPGLD